MSYDYDFGTDVCGGDWVGFIDMAVEQHKMDDLREVTVEIAQLLVQYGQASINRAIAGAKQPWYKADLPGATSRDGVKGKLAWHADTVSRMIGTPTAPYTSANDLKKWTLQAYIEENAVEEGSAALEKSWNDMWAAIETKLASYPKAVLKAAASATSNVLENVTGLPLWAWGLIGVGGLAAVGYAAHKTGILREVVVRRLGGR